MTQTAMTIGRRELLQRGATIAAVAAIPAVGLSVGPSRAAIPIPAASDAELLGLWRGYRKQLRAVKRAAGLKEAAYGAVWDGLGPR
jgi:hypothetical protein